MTPGIFALDGPWFEAAGWRLAGDDPATGSGDHARRPGAGHTPRSSGPGVVVVVSGCPRHFRRSRPDQPISAGGRGRQAKSDRTGRRSPRSGSLDAGGQPELAVSPPWEPPFGGSASPVDRREAATSWVGCICGGYARVTGAGRSALRRGLWPRGRGRDRVRFDLVFRGVDAAGLSRAPGEASPPSQRWLARVPRALSKTSSSGHYSDEALALSTATVRGSR
jgi:hypothetical protein